MAGFETDDVMPLRASVPIDASSTGNGEDPPSEVDPVTVETIKCSADINPHLARHILGRHGTFGEQQSQDLRLVDPPQRCDRIPIAGACTFERVNVRDVPVCV